MFGTIRKHQTWLWAVIITMTIISFVYFFSPTQKMNGAGGATNYGTIDGKKITREEYADAQKEVYLRYYFSTGTWPKNEKNSNFDPMRETYFRLMLIHKMDDLGIHIAENVVAQAAVDFLKPLQRNGPVTPALFAEKVLVPNGFQLEDFGRFVKNELGVQELVSAVGMAGKLVTPEEAKSLYVREHEELKTAAVFFSYSNYLANVTVAPDGLTQFYSNRLSEYRIPERVQVKYVKFDLTNYLADATAELAKITNLTERIDAEYKQRGTNAFKDLTPEQAKAKLHDEFVKGLETRSAREKAGQFAKLVYDKNPQQPSLQDFDAVAKDQKLAVQVSAPFDQQGPKEFAAGMDFATAAFALNPNTEPFAGPLIGEEAVYVIAYEKRLPSEVPPLEQVRSQVETDYRRAMALNMAQQAGETFYHTVTNEMAKGKTFEVAAVEAKAKPVELPPVSIATRTLPEAESLVSLRDLKNVAFSTPVGKVSPFQPTMEGGIVLEVKAKLPIDEAKLRTELPTFVNYVRQTRQNEAFQEWFNKEATKALRDTPLARQKAPTGSAPRTVKS